MTTDQEIQLADDLRHLVAGQSFEADIDLLTRRGQRARRRSLAVRGAAGLGVVALAAGGVVAGLHARPATTTNTATAAPKTTQVTTPKVLSMADVIQQTSAALDTITDYVVQDQATDGPYQYTVWTDTQTGRTYQQGRNRYSADQMWGSTYYVHNVMHSSDTDVDDANHTWWIVDEHSGGAVQGPVFTGPWGGLAGTPAEIKQWLGSGQVTIAGYGEADGHQVVKLQGPARMLSEQVWIDVRTYQPVRIIFTVTYPSGSPQPTDVTTIDETWVPRTAALVDLINNPRVPAGYTKVAPQSK